MNKTELDSIIYDLSLLGKGSFTIDFDLSLYSHRVIFNESRKFGLYEKQISILMGALLQPGDLFIDVGAHIGYFSVLAASLVGETGQVFSFEPITENRKFLEHNIKINSLENVRFIPQVVSNRTGATNFYFNLDNDGGHALWDVSKHPFNKKSKNQPNIRSLQVTRLDDFFSSKDLSRLKMIKIDTEGNEFNVLMGSTDILKRYRIKCIAWEVNRFGLKHMGHSEEGLRNFMYANGYETLAFLDGYLQVLDPGKYINSDIVFSQFFMLREYIGLGNSSSSDLEGSVGPA